MKSFDTARRLEIALPLLVVLLTAGCSHRMGARTASHGAMAGAEFSPQNFHQTSAWLPRDMRRVAILPLTTVADETITDASRDQLELVLQTEITRTELFEVVQVTPDQLRRWTGRARWRVTDALSPDLFQRLQNQLGCDGVIFAQLTSYRPFAPLLMGWKLHLVDTREPRVWWACDVVFDAGDQAVARSATRYERERQGNRLSAYDPATILRSPGRFGQYTIATSLGTLQRHERND